MVGERTGPFGDTDAQVTNAISVTLVNSSVLQSGFEGSLSPHLGLTGISVSLQKSEAVVGYQQAMNALTITIIVSCLGMARGWALGPRDLCRRQPCLNVTLFLFYLKPCWGCDHLLSFHTSLGTKLLNFMASLVPLPPYHCQKHPDTVIMGWGDLHSIHEWTF